MIKFTITRDGQLVEEISTSKRKITVGRRDDNDVVLDANGVSRLHAIIEERNGVYTIADAFSSNGTTVNKKKIASINLQDNDEIVIFPFTISVNITPD